MRILFFQRFPYWYPLSGASRSAKRLLEDLSSIGHECFALTPTGSVQQSWETLAAQLGAHGAQDIAKTNDGATCIINNVSVHGFFPGKIAPYSAEDIDQLSARLALYQQTLKPDLTIISDDYLQLSLNTEKRPTIYTAFSTTTLPWGNESVISRHERARQNLQKVQGVIAISNFLADYITPYRSDNLFVYRFPIYQQGDYPNLSNPDAGYIMMVNPCPAKGGDIFLALARAMPERKFAAIPSWGDSGRILDAFKKLPNALILPPSNNLAHILKNASLMLAPSLWKETFGHIVVESMLYGIPTLVSDYAGLREAKLGVPYLLPVEPIHDYKRANSAYEPIVPPQDIAPWRDTIATLLEDKSHYSEISRLSWRKAHQYKDSHSISSLSDFLTSCS